MTRRNTDVLILGGGLAGLTASCAFGHLGLDTLCVDPAPLGSDELAANVDLRTTAYLQTAQKFLSDIQVWPNAERVATPLETMRIVELGAHPTEHDFQSKDISNAPFGWNVSNANMKTALLTRSQDLANLSFLGGTFAQSITTRSDSAFVRLSDGTQVKAKLVIAADGRNSTIREALGISVQRVEYGQSALVFAVTHPVPHKNISTEIHQSGGPFTLVPLPDHAGQPCSAVVWMDITANIHSKQNLNRNQLSELATQRSDHHFGKLSVITDCAVWPIISQLADQITAQRTALIAETAHVVPPIGAQGLNISLSDIETLYHLAKDNPGQIGTENMLSAYSKDRIKDIRMRVKGVELLNRISMQGSGTSQWLRAMGLSTLHKVEPIRKTVMKAGLGQR